MNRFITTFLDRKEQFFASLLEHVQISLIALLIATAIAIPLAILISRHKKVSELCLQIVGVVQTIPSLAILGLLIPIFGIGRVPAIIALVLYGLFPILQNTLTGLAEIDPSLLEAGKAFGMTEWEQIRKFKIALSMPMIISGVRTSAIMIIGTATLAALVGAGGLGTFILLGIDRNNASLILIGAITSAILAVLVGFGIKNLEKKKPRVILLTSVLVYALLGISFLPGFLIPNNRLVIAGKLGAEPEILINMYKILIEDELKLQVELKPNFGKTSFLYEALKSGSIDIYPEYSGTITSTLLDTPVELPNEPRLVYETARDLIYEQDRLVYLEPMEYENTYAIAIRKEFSEKFHIYKISDLAKVQNSVRAGFSLEFNDREDGNAGLKSIYGLNLEVAVMEPALRYEALERRDIQVIEVYSTDSALKRYNLVVLNDDKRLFPPYQGAPLMKEETLERYPKLKEVFGKLAGKITAEEMSEMNYAVDVGGRSAYDIAYDYLKLNGLVN